MSISSEKNSDRTAAAVVPPSVALYVAGAMVQLAGLAAVAFQIGETGFAVFTMGLTLLGTTVSYFLRRFGARSNILKIGALMLVLVFVWALRSEGPFGALVPPEEVGSQEMLLVSALAFTATFASFLLINDDAIVFMCVWSIAMIGLTGTVNINRELPISFVVFLAAASFVLVHQHALSFGARTEEEDLSALRRDSTRRFPAPPHLSFRWPLLRTHLVMAGATWGASLLLGVMIAIPVQMVGRNMSLATIIQRLKVPPSPITKGGGAPRLIFDDPRQFQVGLGPVDDDPTERLSVYSPHPEYWRGRTYDIYNGHGWGSSEAERPAEMGPTITARDGMATFDLTKEPGRTRLGNIYPRKATERLVATFHVTAGVYGIYHAAEPTRMRAMLPRLFPHTDGTLGGGRGISSDYEIESQVTTARPGDLRHSSTQYPPEISQRYLSVVGENGYYSDALQALAQEAMVGFNNNPYDRVSAIRRFIASRCTYTLEARPVPKDSDAAEFFLNESREGYCDLYATAMTILCRYAGIPARVVTGFAPGVANDDQSDAEPGNPKVRRLRYSLRGTDQHAWTEVYFVGYGWIPFDATIDTGGTTPISRTPQPTVHKKTWLDAVREKILPVLLVAAGVGALLFVIVNELRSRLTRRRTPRSGMALRDQNAEVVWRNYQGAIRGARRRGLPYPEEATMGEHLRSVRAQFGDTAANALEPLTRLAEAALYSPNALTPEDAAAAGRALSNYKTALRDAPRLPRQRPVVENVSENADTLSK